MNQGSIFDSKFLKLNEALCQLLDDFGLISFYPLCVEDKDLMGTVLRVIDKANGYVFGGLEQGNESIMEIATRVGTGSLEDISVVEERYLNSFVQEHEFNSE
jgi:hypothetical protein